MAISTIGGTGANLTDNVGKFIKNIAKAYYKTAPYLTEGATQISSDEVVGKSVGEAYTFKVDDVDVDYSATGMIDDESITTDRRSSRTAEMRIANALALIDNNGLDRKLAFGNWEDFVKNCGAKVAREMTEKVALADLAKGEAVVACDDVNGLVAQLYEMTQWGTCRGYGSFAGVGHILGTSKLNIPVYANDTYTGADNGLVFANLDVLRGIPLPTIKANGTDLSTGKYITVSKEGKVTGVEETSVTSVTAGSWYKVGDAKWVYFPTATITDGVLVGERPSSSSNMTIVANTDTYEPIIVRADGAQGYLDASSLVESADEVGSSDGLGIAHSERNNSKGGKIHRFDAVGAFGIADTKRVKVYLLKNA